MRPPFSGEETCLDGGCYNMLHIIFSHFFLGTLDTLGVSVQNLHPSYCNSDINCPENMAHGHNSCAHVPRCHPPSRRSAWNSLENSRSTGSDLKNTGGGHQQDRASHLKRVRHGSIRQFSISFRDSFLDQRKENPHSDSTSMKIIVTCLACRILLFWGLHNAPLKSFKELSSQERNHRWTFSIVLSFFVNLQPAGTWRDSTQNIPKPLGVELWNSQSQLLRALCLAVWPAERKKTPRFSWLEMDGKGWNTQNHGTPI